MHLNTIYYMGRIATVQIKDGKNNGIIKAVANNGL